MATGGAGIGGAGSIGSIRFTFEIEGGERVDLALSRFGEEISDWREFWQDHFAPKFLADIQQNFETEGQTVGAAGFGTGWPALSPAYAAWKAKHFPGRKILERTGRLKDSLTWGGGSIGPEGILELTETSAVIGTSVPYARPHQLGLGVLPQRRFLWAATSVAYGRLIHRYLTGRAQRAGLPTTGALV